MLLLSCVIVVSAGGDGMLFVLNVIGVAAVVCVCCCCRLCLLVMLLVVVVVMLRFVFVLLDAWLVVFVAVAVVCDCCG